MSNATLRNSGVHLVHSVFGNDGLDNYATFCTPSRRVANPDVLLKKTFPIILQTYLTKASFRVARLNETQPLPDSNIWLIMKND